MTNKTLITIILILFLLLVYTRVESINDFDDAIYTIQACKELLEEKDCSWTTVYDHTIDGRNNITAQRVCS